MLKTSCLMVLLGCFALFAASTNDSLTGTVTDTSGKAIKDVSISLVKQTVSAIKTDSMGKFSMVLKVQAKAPYNIAIQNSAISMGVQGNHVRFTTASGAENASIAVFSSNGRRSAMIQLGKLKSGTSSHILPEMSPGFYILQITADQMTVSNKLVNTGKEMYLSGDANVGPATTSGTMAVVTAAIDTLVAVKSGFKTVKQAIESYSQKGIIIKMTPEAVIACTVPTLPAASALTYSNAKLPDPFTFKFLDLPRVTTKAQWECRRAEIKAMAEDYLYGHMPPKPEEVTGTVSGGKITVNMKNGSKSASFTVDAKGSGSILVIEYSGGTPAPENSRKYTMTPSDMLTHMKTLYGSTDAGTCMAAAWGVARIIDVLELNPDGGIDATKVVTTGCSFAGKFAAIAGIFEPRVGLCVPVESGACGTCSWRVAVAYGGKDSNKNCQDIKNLEQNWLGSGAGPFRNGQVSVEKLPFDQGEVMGLRAPRPMIAFNNYRMWMWLCSKGNVAAAQSCHYIYKALGASDNFGFAESKADHGHCSWPAEHTPQLNAFYDKFLNGKTDVDTKIMQWHPDSDQFSKWIDWDTTVVLQ